MKLLFVDDEQMIVRGLSILMDYSKLGFDTVLTASDTQTAMEIIHTEKPDVIVSDIVMPGMTGLALLRTLREMKMNARVIFLSGYQKFSYAQEAVSLGASAYLLKPVDRVQLEQALREAVKAAESEHDSRLLSSAIRDIAGEKPRERQIENPERKCCLGIVFSAPKEGRSSLENGLLQFAACSTGESIAEKNGATAFVKEDHLVVILQAEQDEDLIPRMEHILSLIAESIAQKLPVDVRTIRSDVMESSRGIPDAHARLLTMLSAKEVQVESEQNPIEKAKNYIREHYGDEITLERAAAVACMSAGYFSTVFRKETGIGFKNYLTQVRMEAAQKLLLQTGMKIYEIAEKVGMADTRYFSETFQRQVGMTPQQFRSQGRTRTGE